MNVREVSRGIIVSPRFIAFVTVHHKHRYDSNETTHYGNDKLNKANELVRIWLDVPCEVSDNL